MICTRCQGQNADNVNFCIHCGAPLRITCPNCGTVNAAKAKFCTSCGRSFVVTSPPPPMPFAAPAISPQHVVVVKQGAPGWIWALTGILLAVIVVGGLDWLDLLPLDFLKTSPPQTQLPVAPPEPEAESTEAPTALASIESYCPQSGGVILYWNAGFDCTNGTGDLGFRQRVGDGAQGLNTGHFDNQASAIQIPPAWSVKLYEDSEMQGASVCFNTSVPNFADRGNFPGKNILINENVSAMVAYRDGTCGEDLAKGAAPAPWPKVDWPEAQPGVPGMEPAAPGCEFVSACPCLPAELEEMKTDGPEVDNQVFNDKYFKSAKVEGNKLTLEFKDFANLFDRLNDLGINMAISYDHAIIPLEPTCEKNAAEPGGVTCSVEFPQQIGAMADYLKASVLLYSRPDPEGARIETCLLSQDNPLPVEAELEDKPVNCRVYGCSQGYECKIVSRADSGSSNNTWDCVETQITEPEPAPPPQCADPNDSCCMYGIGCSSP